MVNACAPFLCERNFEVVYALQRKLCQYIYIYKYMNIVYILNDGSRFPIYIVQNIIPFFMLTIAIRAKRNAK